MWRKLVLGAALDDGPSHCPGSIARWFGFVDLAARARFSSGDVRLSPPLPGHDKIGISHAALRMLTAF